MKLITLLFATFPIFSSFVTAEEPDPLKNEFVEIAKNLYPADTLLRWSERVRHPEPSDTPDAIEAARKLLSAAKDSIPKIRKLLKPGSSIFDYPGLLSLGRITHSGIYFASKASPEYEYRLYIGAHFQEGEGVYSFDFDVCFNERGVITRIENVDWKK